MKLKYIILLGAMLFSVAVSAQLPVRGSMVGYQSADSTNSLQVVAKDTASGVNQYRTTYIDSAYLYSALGLASLIDKNWSENNITLTGNRSHTFNSNTLTMDGSFGDIIFRPSAGGSSVGNIEITKAFDDGGIEVNGAVDAWLSLYGQTLAQVTLETHPETGNIWRIWTDATTEALFIEPEVVNEVIYFRNQANQNLFEFWTASGTMKLNNYSPGLNETGVLDRLLGVMSSGQVIKPTWQTIVDSLETIIETDIDAGVYYEPNETKYVAVDTMKLNKDLIILADDHDVLSIQSLVQAAYLDIYHVSTSGQSQIRMRNQTQEWRHYINGASYFMRPMNSENIIRIQDQAGNKLFDISTQNDNIQVFDTDDADYYVNIRPEATPMVHLHTDGASELRIESSTTGDTRVQFKNTSNTWNMFGSGANFQFEPQVADGLFSIRDQADAVIMQFNTALRAMYLYDGFIDFNNIGDDSDAWFSFFRDDNRQAGILWKNAAGQIHWSAKMTNGAAGNFHISRYIAGAFQENTFEIHNSDGQFEWNTYGSGSHTETETYIIGVAAGGQVGEMDAADVAAFIGSSTQNIYTADGTLGADRTVTQNALDLSFVTTTGYTEFVDGADYVRIEPDGSNMIHVVNDGQAIAEIQGTEAILTLEDSDVTNEWKWIASGNNLFWDTDGADGNIYIRDQANTIFFQLETADKEAFIYEGSDQIEMDPSSTPMMKLTNDGEARLTIDAGSTTGIYLENPKNVWRQIMSGANIFWEPETVNATINIRDQADANVFTLATSNGTLSLNKYNTGQDGTLDELAGFTTTGQVIRRNASEVASWLSGETVDGDGIYTGDGSLTELTEVNMNGWDFQFEDSGGDLILFIDETFHEFEYYDNTGVIWANFSGANKALWLSDDGVFNGGAMLTIKDEDAEIIMTDSDATDRYVSFRWQTAGGDWYMKSGASGTTNNDWSIGRAAAQTDDRVIVTRDQGTRIQVNEANNTTPVLVIQNDATTNDNYIHFDGNDAIEDFVFGVDDSADELVITEDDNDLTSGQFLAFDAGANTTNLRRDVDLEDQTFIDENDSGGSVDQVLVRTATGIDWQDQAGGSDTHLGNADLSTTADRIFTMGSGHDLTFRNSNGVAPDVSYMELNGDNDTDPFVEIHSNSPDIVLELDHDNGLDFALLFDGGAADYGIWYEETDDVLTITESSSPDTDEIAAFEYGGASGAFFGIGRTDLDAQLDIYAPGTAQIDIRGNIAVAANVASIEFYNVDADINSGNPYRMGEILMHKDHTSDLENVLRFNIGITEAGAVSTAMEIQSIETIAAGGANSVIVKDAGEANINVALRNATTTITTEHFTVYSDNTSSYTWTVDDAANFENGAQLTFVKANATGTITIARTGSDTFDGATSLSVTQAGGSVTIRKISSNYWTVL